MLPRGFYCTASVERTTGLDRMGNVLELPLSLYFATLHEFWFLLRTLLAYLLVNQMSGSLTLVASCGDISL